ncbi:phage head closure protein [Yoonia sp. 208BN28-4]|uniref:phage head closure protein n=1 Tax=Yoonia sp. 208BN28-4 TaxID=3126505 RepID=UPI00309E7AB0
MTVPQLNRSLTLLTPVQAPDDAGGLITSWVSLGVLWAEMKPASTRETTGFAGPVSKAAYKITVRAAATGSPRRPKAGQRFTIGTRQFEVETVVERDLDGRYLTCLCKEEVAS